MTIASVANLLDALRCIPLLEPAQLSEVTTVLSTRVLGNGTTGHAAIGWGKGCMGHPGDRP